MNQPRKVSSEAMDETLRRYNREILLNKRFMFPAFILPGVGVALSQFVPVLLVSHLLQIYQTTGTITPQKLIIQIVLIYVVWFAGEMVYRLSEYCNEQGAYRAMKHLYSQAMEELLHRDMAFFNDNFAGSITKRALDYGASFEDYADKIGKNFATFVITFIFSVIVLFRFSPWIPLVLFVLFAITLRGSFFFLRRRLPIVLQRNAAYNESAGVLADVVANVNTVKTFGSEEQELSRYRDTVKKQMDLRLKSWRYWNERHDMFVSPMYVLINVLGLCLAIYVGQKSTVNSAAIFVTFNYIALITRTLWELGPIYVGVERSISNAAEHVEPLLHESRVNDYPHAVDLKVKNSEIEFRNVSFYYESKADQALFKNLNLTVKPGQKIGLVGHSGGGKTTITKLLLRFMDIQGGQILIDGQNVASVTQQSLRRSIAYIPQEPLLFHRSLADNISYGKSGASKKDVQMAAKKSHAAEFIDQLPDGFETLVGERGVKLSGGQRQRIAIARAILKDAPILVLDEATSALDSESEILIQKALWQLMEGRTAIVIAHRLSTIQKMDRIIVLDQGQIIEDGSHQELLKNKGKYAELWAHQSGGFIEE